jgi:hypothetical protein
VFSGKHEPTARQTTPAMHIQHGESGVQNVQKIVHQPDMVCQLYSVSAEQQHRLEAGTGDESFGFAILSPHYFDAHQNNLRVFY